MQPTARKVSDISALLVTALAVAFAPSCMPAESASNGHESSGGSSSPGGSGGAAGSGGSTTGAGGTSKTSSSGGNTSSGGTKSSGGTMGAGGTKSSGGTTGSGGTSRSGGTTGSGGTSRSGGTTGAGGTTSSGGTTGAGGSSASGSANFTVKVETSTAIQTVGIVTWSVDVPVDSAVVKFGRDKSNFEYEAPVDLKQTDNRTLLLGMKQALTYYVQVVVQSGGKTYSSDVASVKSGYLPAGIPTFKKTDKDAASLYAGGGFTVSCTGLAGSMGIGGVVGKSWAFIFDKDAETVWAHELTNTVANTCSRARMSVDGQFMWAGDFANASTAGSLYRIGMDGLGTGKTWSLPGRSHDFALMPNGNPLFFDQNNGGGYTNGKEGPDSIKELDLATGKVNLIYDEMTDYADLINAAAGSHTNQVNYIPTMKAISFSMRHVSTIGLISYPEGKLLGTFGGSKSTFSAMNWSYQHGHEIFEDHIWVFNNQGKTGAADVLRFTYDLAKKTATQELNYSSGIACAAFGDVKELPNGNAWVTYSVTGAFHEITKDGKLVREVTTGTAVGYSEHMATLYGSPPPFDR